MDSDGKTSRRRFPPWLTKRIGGSTAADEVATMLRDLGLSTVCASARCPNQHECFSRRTATFLILGDACTRSCRFCAISHRPPAPPRDDEPQAVAEACQRLALRHVVLTSVTRDDLPDGGAEHFARTIHAVRERLPRATVEVLVPDFQGDHAAIETVVRARPNVFNHNVETVSRLYGLVRPQADYRRSLDVLAFARQAADAKLHTKSGLMMGLGETRDEVLAVFADLRAAGCDILTVGQYLAPSDAHVPVARFVAPGEFDELARIAREMGFRSVAAGPFVRSSYRAETVFREAEPT
ncbi:MAG TPA: lipoyl synthase [Phycisphaerae bacterium]|nr:lipoyl synthase [Phycisphaerae bacterium]